MEIKMIEGKAFDRIKQCLNELLEKSKKLNPKRVDEEWFTNQEVCQLFGISLRTLQSYRDKGVIPYSQVGHKYYYKVKDVERLMQESKSETKK